MCNETKKKSESGYLAQWNKREKLGPEARGKV